MSYPACYFESIKLSNIKSFGQKGEVLHFTKPTGELSQWTLLLGDNGVGKTTVLQCLAEMCADLTGPLKHPPPSVKGEPIYQFPRVLRYVVTAAAHQMSYGRVGSQTSSIRVKFNMGVHFGSKVKAKAEDSSLDSFLTLTEGKFASCGSVQDRFSALQPCGYGAFRRFGSTKLGAELNPDPCSTLFEDNEPLLNVEEWLLRSDYAVTKSKDLKAQRRLAHIKGLLIKFLPEVEDIRIQASGAKVPTPEAKTPDGWVPVRSLSTGYRATMAWVTDFAARMLDRYSESQTPFSEPAVVLVDQIDSHLHPKWQRQLIQDLSDSFPGTQFIVTAHSPLMVLAMPEANIVVLRRDGDHVTIGNRPDDVRGWRLDQVLASELFEEQPTRDVDTQSKLEERRTLLIKDKLTKEQRARLDKLNIWASTIPTADAPEDIRAMEIIRRASSKLEGGRV